MPKNYDNINHILQKRESIFYHPLFFKKTPRSICSLRLGLPAANRWPGIRGRRIFHPDSEMLTTVFAFPAHLLHQGVDQLNGSLEPGGARHHATSVIPAFLREYHEGRLPLLGVWEQNIHDTNAHAFITPVTMIRIKNHRPRWGRRIGENINLVFI